MTCTPADADTNVSGADAENGLLADALDDAIKCLNRVRETFASLKATTVTLQLKRPVLETKLKTAQDLLVGTLQDARYLHNAMRPVARLPPELLCTIFLELREGFMHVRDPASIIARHRDRQLRSHLTRDLVKYESLCSPSHPFSWMIVMHVCRRWNEVAKACPELWSTIIFDEFFDCAPLMTMRSKGVYPQLFLRRAAGAPLKLSLSGSGSSHHLSGAHILLAHVQRAQELHLRGSLLDTRVKAKVLFQPAPRLKALILSSPTGGAFSLPTRRIFGGSLPSLRSLAFIDARITDFADSLQPSYHQLRQLYIAFNRSPISLANLLTILRTTVNVEDVLFRDHVYHGGQAIDAVPLGPLVSLPKLKRLALSYHGPKESFMRALSLPSGVLCTLSGAWISIPAAAPNGRAALLNLKHMKQMKIYYGRMFLGSPQYVEDCIFATGDASALQIHRGLSSLHTQGGPEWLIDGIEGLWVEGEYRPFSWIGRGIGSILTDILGRTSGLRSIVLNAENERGLTEFLRVLQKPDLCPSLATLEIRVPTLTVVTIELLCSVVKARKSAGRLLATLHLGRHAMCVEAPGMSYAEWKESASARLRDFVGELVFVDGEPVPRMPAPPICHTPSSGWDWPEWSDK